MRRLPVNWAIGALVSVCVVIVVFTAIAVMLVLKLARIVRWPRLRDRRRAWKPIVADVEATLIITDVGDVRLDLAIPLALDDYRTRQRRHVRGITRLTREALDRIAHAHTIPIRIDPNAPLSIAIDLEEMVGREEGEAFARRLFVDRGAEQWKEWKPADANATVHAPNDERRPPSSIARD